MVGMLRILFVLVGYLCTATMIAAALCLAYLRHTDRLNDDKMFRIVAMLHDVDLNQIAAVQADTTDEIPPEELSLDNVTRYQQVLDRNYEAKLLALQRGRQEYDHRLQQIKEQTSRYDRLARDWHDRLKQQEDIATQENVAKVVRDLEQVKPAIGKDLLVRWIKEERMDDVIMLMNRVSEGKLAKVLKTFQTPDELDMLHEIHQRIINGGHDKSQLDKALNELNGIDNAS
jgi:hypothetical protein